MSKASNQTPEIEIDPKKAKVKPSPAVYHTPVVPLYRGNPLIHALPKVPGPAGLIDKLECMPPRSDEDLSASPEDRKEMLECLKFFFQPLPRHSNLAQSIFSMIRVGYAGRCPDWGQPPVDPCDSAMESAALIGSSGTGKTKSVRRILSMIPQVILHTEFPKGSGNVISKSQVAWLRVECPHDASPRGLCTSFFEKLDEVLGAPYNDRYGGTRSTTNIMIPKVTWLVDFHHIGLLVIDEIQNLFMRKSNASQDLKDFIVRIINDLRVPVLMIGTAEAADFLDMSFRVSRRTTGLLQPNWARLVQGEREWSRFMDALLEYRYVKKEPPSVSDLRDKFFYLTQGIPDLCVKLYFLAQRYAINEGIEQVTPDLLQKVSDTSLVQNKRYLMDLRAGRRPRDGFVYEPVFEQQSLPLALADQAVKNKKGKKRPQASANAPIVNLPGIDVREGETTYDAARRNGLMHSPDGEPTAPE